MHYTACQQLGVVIGTIADIDTEASMLYPDGSTSTAGNPLVLLNVEHAFPYSLPKTVLVGMAVVGGPPWSKGPPMIGETVLITYARNQHANLPPDDSERIQPDSIAIGLRSRLTANGRIATAPARGLLPVTGLFSAGALTIQR